MAFLASTGECPSAQIKSSLEGGVEQWLLEDDQRNAVAAIGAFTGTGILWAYLFERNKYSMASLNICGNKYG
jgi:hypothetical protein